MSEVKVNKVTPRSGTTLTIGDSGDTTNVVGTLQNNGAALVGDISSVVAGTNLSGGGTSGAVTINLADASTSAKGAASFSSNNFAASSGAVTIKDLGVATAKIQDAAVTTGKINDDAITLGKMAPGTDGNIISYDASGNPVAIATGSDGQVLTSAGAGAQPAFETLPVGGITMADQWRPNASISGNSQIYTSEWIRISGDSPGYFGSAMTQSSGVFTFPSTGKYWIQFRATFKNSGSSLYIGSNIEVTENNSSFSNASIAYASVHDSNAYQTNVCSLLFNCSNTSTHKVRFGQAGNQSGTVTFIGGQGSNESEVTFIRLGD